MPGVAVIQFPGSNCDADTQHVLAEQFKAQVHMVWHRQDRLPQLDGVVIPGGFSYGDYLRSGAVAALSPVMAAVKSFAERGGPVLGICNGFQILTEAGLLPGQLARNPVLHFVCKPVHLRVERSSPPFTSTYSEGDVLELPIAHNEGSYFVDEVTLGELEANGQVMFRYCTPAGAVVPEANPNGSLHNIAGLCNRAGNVLGMMPHPERACEGLLGSEDGRGIFESLLTGVGMSL